MKSKDNILQNLLDAGCSRELAEKITELLINGDEEQANLLIKQHRKCLLNSVHAYKKNIDCLDYLVYALEKDKKSC